MSPRDTSPETMTIFSPKLAERLDLLVARYPVRRSALIPMLLYAQDEVGYLSDAVIAEVADRTGITELDVRNVATYYSMLRFKPAGKFNIQVCTNISCMLRGAYEVYERFQEDLGLRGITDGEFRRTYFHIDFLTMACFRSKKWNALEPAAGRRRSR